MAVMRSDELRAPEEAAGGGVCGAGGACATCPKPPSSSSSPSRSGKSSDPVSHRGTMLSIGTRHRTTRHNTRASESASVCSFHEQPATVRTHKHASEQQP